MDSPYRTPATSSQTLPFTPGSLVAQVSALSTTTLGSNTRTPYVSRAATPPPVYRARDTRTGSWLLGPTHGEKRSSEQPLWNSTLPTVLSPGVPEGSTNGHQNHALDDARRVESERRVGDMCHEAYRSLGTRLALGGGRRPREAMIPPPADLDRLERDQRSTTSLAPSEGSSTLPPSYSSHFGET